MSIPSTRPDQTTVYYFLGQSARIAGKSCWRYRCFTADSQLLFSAHATRGFRPAPVFFSGQETKPDYLLKMRKTFPFTGKIDLIEAPSGGRRGIVTRSRKFFDGQGRLVGRFHNETSWKDYFGESMFEVAGQLILGGDDSNVTATSSNCFALAVEGRPAGGLTRHQLPFFPDPPRRSRPSAAIRGLMKLLPRKVGSALFDTTPPGGWKLELRDESATADRDLLLCATMMIIEINRW